MSVRLQRNKPPLDINDPIVLVPTAGMSHTFLIKREIESFQTVGSTVVTIDLGSQLFDEIIEWKWPPVSSLPVQVLEVQDWERIIEKLNALESVFGMLNELTPEQRESFEKAVKRRPLFK
jgi:hypothetical protein